MIPEGGGLAPKATYICGFLGCDLSPFNPLFNALPRLLVIRRPEDDRRDLLDRLIDLAMAEVQTKRFGGESVRLGLCELMFVELLRRYLARKANGDGGWLTGLKDPCVGRALTLLHGDPARAWTLETLARAAGVSRSVLAERFAGIVGETPMRYLHLWRMQLAARRLSDGGDKVADIADQIGFKSEAAFSRAFKRVTGQSPTAWRRRGSNSAVP